MPFSRMSDVVTKIAEVHRVPRRSTLASVSFLLSVLIAILAALSGFGSRWGLWGFKVGFSLLRWSVFLAMMTGLLSLIALWITLPLRSETRGFTLSLLSLLISGFIIYWPIQWKLVAEEAPAIHDITTNLDDPPEYRATRSIRAKEQNSLDYDTELTEIQKKHYPDIEPAYLRGTPEECMQESLQLTRDLEWAIQAANWDKSRIEATSTSYWFGFKDDVVIEISKKNENRCRIDLRSNSRVGIGDAGTNARRIKKFLRRLKNSG